MDARAARARPVLGRRGIDPHWARSAKDGAGTAYATSSRLWYTLSLGIITEVYFPTIDRPQLRDLQYLITDGQSLFHDERRDLVTSLDALSEHALGFHVTNADREARYQIGKEVIADPHPACVPVRTQLDGAAPLLPSLRLFVLLAPPLHVGGWGTAVARL